MKKVLLAAVLMGMMLTGCNLKSDNNQNEEDMNTTLTLTQEWDKVFPQSDKVDHRKITFHNRYGIELAADMYTPKGDKETGRQGDKKLRGSRYPAQGHRPAAHGGLQERFLLSQMTKAKLALALAWRKNEG